MNDDLDNVRRMRLMRYLQERWPPPLDFQKEFTKALKGKLSKGRVSQILNYDIPFKETAARNLARKLKLREDYFESDQPGAGIGKPTNGIPAAERDRLLFVWGKLFEDQRRPLMEKIEEEYARAVRIEEEVKQRGLISTVPEDVLPRVFTRPAQRELPMAKPPEVAKKGKR